MIRRDKASERRPENRAEGIMIAGKNDDEKRTSYMGGIRPARYRAQVDLKHQGGGGDGQRADGGPYLGYGKGRAWPLLTGERGHYEFATGRDPRPFLKAIESFASAGGMLPEQVWDEPDRDHMKLGRPIGSAMPLCWAHAEYIKLLRSVYDGQVFDVIPIVADRYHRSLGRKDMEVWKPVRRLRSIRPGKVLRVQNPGPFRMVWTDDEWKTIQDSESSPSGLGIGFVDIPIGERQKASIRFTFFWPDTSTWEGKDYKVDVETG